MGVEITRIPLLHLLRELRRTGGRVSSSFITTYAVHLPFYEEVILPTLEAAGSRLNIVLVDAGQLTKAFVAASTRPRRAGTDYLLIPVHAGGAFHPKIIAIFSDKGVSVAIGSHNLTEAGFGRNGEISVTFGLERGVAPPNVSRPIAEYLLSCAGQLATGEAAFSRRLADRLQLQSSHGTNDNDVTFTGSIPGGTSLLDGTFKRDELAVARRILVLGPYFDNDLSFLATLRTRAPRAEIVVAIQPQHAVLKRGNRLPARTRLCDANVLQIRNSQSFLHAKALIVEARNRTVVALGSANPSRPAWLGDEARGNFEAMITLRGDSANRAIRELRFDLLWDAPPISLKQLKEIEQRSRMKTDEEEVTTSRITVGLWKQGWVEAQLAERVKSIQRIRKLTGLSSEDVSLDGATIEGRIIRFATPEAGVFALELASIREPRIVIAYSISAMKAALTSGAAARLIDELGRLDGGAAPGEELFDLCEKVLLERDVDNEDSSIPSHIARQVAAGGAGQDEESWGPRGISIPHNKMPSRNSVVLSLDISAIIGLLLKEFEVQQKEDLDPTAEEDTEDSIPEEDDGDVSKLQKTNWQDIVVAVRRRITHLLNRLAACLEEKHSPKWQYERILVVLALLKRLRKFHPGNTISFLNNPERLVSNEQIRTAFKLAIRCWFARDGGIVNILGRMGGVDDEHEVIGRALLLWAAYEAGVDSAPPKSFPMDSEEVRMIQADRTDAMVSAIAAAGNDETLKRARRELLDRGLWYERRDRPELVEAWFKRHAELGRALQKALHRRPPSLPLVQRPPSIGDLLVWTHEPNWPRLPQALTRRAVHLADVGDAKPIKIDQDFIRAVNLDALGFSWPVPPPSSGLQRLNGRQVKT